MIYAGSQLLVVDNTGARHVQCIKVYTKHPHKAAGMGDVVLVTVKSMRSQMLKTKMKPGQMFKALIVGTKKNKQRKNGRLLCFGTNTCLLLNTKNEILGSRFLEPGSFDIKKQNIAPLANLLPYIV